MAQIQRSEVVQGFVESLRLDAAAESMPTKVSDMVVPTYDYSNARFCDVIKSANRTTTGSSTLMTTPTDRDFFLTAAHLMLQADATSDSTTVGAFLSVIVNGATITLMRFAKLATTATVLSDTMALPIPLKIDRNTAITLSQTFTVGAQATSATIVGFTSKTDRSL